MKRSLVLAALPVLAALAYSRRASIGCAMIDAGQRILPEQRPRDEVEREFLEKVADYCARQQALRASADLNAKYRP